MNAIEITTVSPDCTYSAELGYVPVSTIDKIVAAGHLPDEPRYMLLPNWVIALLKQDERRKRVQTLIRWRHRLRRKNR